MGVSYFASVLYGVPYKHERITTKVRKYDEDTGKPYMKSEYTACKAFQLEGGSLAVPEIDEQLHDDFHEEYDHGSDSGWIGVAYKSAYVKAQEYAALDLKEMEGLRDRFEVMVNSYFDRDVAYRLKANAKLYLVSYCY